jgi:signal peptidase II
MLRRCTLEDFAGDGMKIKFVWVTIFVLALDHLTKYWVSSRMSLGDNIEVIRGWLRISYVLNYGVAFGLFSEPQSVWKPYLLGGMAVAAVVVIVIYSLRMPPGRVFLQASLAIITGGILGNFIDRMLHGFVVDFIEMHIRNRFFWPTFNIADSAITIGIVMLLIDTLRHPDHEAIPAAPPGGEALGNGES